MKFVFAIACVLVLLVSVNGSAFEPEYGGKSDVSLRTEKIVVFKDGYCLLVKRLKAVTDKTGSIVINEIPENAVLGSFWAVSENDRLVSIKAEETEVVIPKQGENLCLNYIELLETNKGRQCTVYARDDSVYSGTICEVLATECFYPEYQDEAESGQELTSQLIGDLFVLENGTKRHILPVSGIRNLDIENATYRRSWQTEEKKSEKRLVLNFDRPGREEKVLLFYFTPGFRWIPSYRLDLDSPGGTASISLQAELINSLGDITDAAVDLVVGVPNIKFKNIRSPLALEMLVQSTANELNMDSGPNRQAMLSNAMFSQSLENRNYDTTSAGSENQGTESFMPADNVQDFYLFSLTHISLRKGAVLSVPLFTEEVSYHDVYVWNVNIVQNAAALEPAGRKNEILHYIELHNSSKWPWTTGPAMIMEGFVPLGQDLLKYTAMGNKVRIPLSVATDIHGSWESGETSRKENALKLNRQYYARIDKEAKLTVKNFSAKSIDLEIILGTGGKAEKASGSGKISIDSFHSEDWANYYQMQLNNHSTVTWKTTLKKGREFSAECAFSYFAVE